MTDTAIETRTADWHRDREALMAIRIKVFVEEQGVPLALEQDESDPKCRHLLAYVADHTPVGTARLTPTGQIGRMAVLREWRRHGIGTHLLNGLLDIAAHSNLKEVFLNAQLSACGFYRQAGFQPEGPVFEEAGISHRRMYKRLVPT